MRRSHTPQPAVIRVPDKLLAAGFVQVPVKLLMIPDLGMGAKQVFAILLWYHHRQQGYWPGRAAMAEEFGVAERSIVRHLQELEQAGLIEIERSAQGYIEAINLAPADLWPPTTIERALGPKGGGEGKGTRVTKRHSQGDMLRVPPSHSGRVPKAALTATKSHSVAHDSFSRDIDHDQRQLLAFSRTAKGMLKRGKSESEIMHRLQEMKATDAQALAAFRLAEGGKAESA